MNLSPNKEFDYIVMVQELSQNCAFIGLKVGNKSKLNLDGNFVWREVIIRQLEIILWWIFSTPSLSLEQWIFPEIFCSSDGLFSP